MKFVIVLAAVLAVSSAQFFTTRSPYSSYPKPTFAPTRPAAPVYTPPRAAAPVYTPLRAAAPSYSPPRPAVAASAPRASSNDQNANVVKYDNVENAGDGAFSYTYETDNGIAASAQGTPRDFGGNPPVVPVVIQGAFSFYSPEGEAVSINYIADENGYQPSGAAIPTPPPVPPQIARALEYLAKNGQ